MSEKDTPSDQTGAPVSEERDTNLDAMGNDKRRTVMGETYGPTVRKQLTVYGIAIAVMVLLVIGSLTVVDAIDNREMPLEDTAPWTAEGTTLEHPGDIDFSLDDSANQGRFPEQ